jgi:Putative prokaryotic signal transducing protein
MVEVGVYRTRSDAEIARGALAAAGIEAYVSADDAGGAIPFDLSAGVRLLVEDADAEDAAAVLQERE